MPQYSQYDVPDSKNMINLGVGQPATSELPIEWFNKTLNKLSNQNLSSEFLQYGSIPGYDSIRENLANWLNDKAYSKTLISKEKLFMTNGNTGALQLIMNLEIETGDEIIIEDPTYFIAQNIFKEYGLNINSIPMESDGINVELLEKKIIEIIKNDEKNLQSKIFLYTIPIHHNPTSITLSHTKRLKIAQLCTKYPKFYVIADEVYHFLSFDNDIEHNPFADYHSKIISLGSFSKLVAPSLRVGWIYQKDIKKLINSALLDSSGGINPLGFLIIESGLKDGSLNSIIDKNVKMLKEKCNIILEFLQPQLDDIKLIIPKGGYFLWLELSVDGTEFLNFALNYKVKFHPGIKFGNSKKNFIRLSFSYYDSDDLITGISRLLEAYKLFKKIRVSLCGYKGKLGSLIRNHLNSDLYFLNPIEKDIKVDPTTSIIIDVSAKEGTLNLINYLIQNNINKPLIVGTTGLTPKTLDLLRIYSVKNQVAVISNFSQGVNKVMKIVNEFNSLDDDWKFSMVEKHRTEKKDSPSGTAKTLTSLMNRKCEIDAIREGDIIGYHEIKIESNEETIILSHNAKSRDIFAKGCVKFIPDFINRPPGLYNNFDLIVNDKYYEVYKSLGDTYLISNDLDNLNDFIEDTNNKYNYFIHISEESKNDWTVYDKTGEITRSNGNDLLVAFKYLNKKFNIKSGKTVEDEHIFKLENNTYYFEMPSPKEYIVDPGFSSDLTALINQLSGLNIIGISTFSILNKYLIIEIKEDLFDIDNEIITTLGSIINSEGQKSYDIAFVNIMPNNMIRVKFYDYYKGKETDGNAYACISVFDYFANINNLPFEDDLEATIILNNDIVKTYYKKDKYFISYTLKND
jgi:2-aminoadipate transaminase